MKSGRRDGERTGEMTSDGNWTCVLHGHQALMWSGLLVVPQCPPWELTSLVFFPEFLWHDVFPQRHTHESNATTNNNHLVILMSVNIHLKDLMSLTQLPIAIIFSSQRLSSSISKIIFPSYSFSRLLKHNFDCFVLFFKLLTQLAQPHTQWAKHLRSIAKWNTLVKTIH